MFVYVGQILFYLAPEKILRVWIHGQLFYLNQFSAPELSEETVPKLLGIANLLKVRRLLSTNKI